MPVRTALRSPAAGGPPPCIRDRAVVACWPPGPGWACRYHQYKFIVDGEWRHDDTQPFMPDPLGNVNNWLFVRKPDGQQTQG